MATAELSVVVPLFNESEVISEFAHILRDTLDSLTINYEVIFVDDGSQDDSLSVLRSLTWPQAKVLVLMINAGHQNALEAGMSRASGKWIVTMDGDLQHPPRYIESMVNLATLGNLDVVYAVRNGRTGDSWLKRVTAFVYYKLMRWTSGVKLVPNSADFRLLSRRAVDVLLEYPEEKVFRLLVPSLNLPSATIVYEVAPRWAGSTKYSLRAMSGLAVRSITGFSPGLLRGVSLIGLAMSLGAVIWLVLVLVSFALDNTVSGWASLMTVVLVTSSIQLLALGLIGEYLSSVTRTLKRRPNYLIDDEFRLD